MICTIIISTLFLAYSVCREFLFTKERKCWQEERQKLLDRIQAKDFLEYKRAELMEKPKPKEEKEEKKNYEFV